ncbi:uncharacterized protein LOC129096242 isoform X2 [Anoplopoma fimbria]|uniref:uncharacterized protein LOC129096242 isoform X2 n=1 Tax=Anoplopoma fimbria TaxID=229290 RepID=UPI0023EACB49|nr:uncharacterized protein LOC129096242 isoform X2 [Anoplopoma fimbria]
MDLRTVVTFSTLLLIIYGQTSLGTNSTTPPSLTQTTNSTSTTCSCPSATQIASDGPARDHSSSAPVLGLLTIRWRRKCEGEVTLTLQQSSSAVCYNSAMNMSLLGNVCENQDGCKGTPHWNKGLPTSTGYDIPEPGAGRKTDCESLRVRCTEEVLPDLQGQLQAYKVVTALLCCLLLVLLLIRFTRPTVKALQKRLSERRQNRWIGPTQSHSALERLAVSDSREPSSNRNSDYNL